MYTVKCDGQWLYNQQLGYILSDPELTLADSSAGSLSFVIDPSHPRYNGINQITSRITVYRNDKEIWEGRPIINADDFYKNMQVICEGELAYLNDSIQPQAEFHDHSVKDFLTKLITVHNKQVNDDRIFQIGEVTVEGNLYRYTNRENTLACINDKLVERLGGHLRVRKENGIRYLDYLKDYPKKASQKIKFGQNLLDYSTNFDLQDIATVIIPLGSQIENEDVSNEMSVLTKYVTVSSVNGGSEFVTNEDAIKEFGWFCKVVHWDDVSEPRNLLTKAKQFLTDIQYDKMELELSAVDFNLVDKNIVPFDVLDQVIVESVPHGIIGKEFPIEKMTISLNDPGNSMINLGGTSNYNKSISSKSSTLSQEIEKKLSDIVPSSIIVKEAIDRATKLIVSGELGSNVIVTSNEIFIMDTEDKQTAKNVWRWNLNGLGFSSNGINGPYELAMTMDGNIIANSFTANNYIYVDGNTESYFKIPVLKDKNYYAEISAKGFKVVTPKLRGSNNKAIVEIGGIPETSEIPIDPYSSDIYIRGIRIGIKNPRTSIERSCIFELGITDDNKPEMLLMNSNFNNTINSHGITILDKNNMKIFSVDGYQYNSEFGYGLIVRGDFSVSGTKRRTVKTENYGERNLYCYETPSPFFGDIGEGIIGEDGICYIHIDGIFSQTVSLNQYQVFIQKYGEGDCYVYDKRSSFFVVKGTPNLKFGWELKAKQKDFDQFRLDRTNNKEKKIQ